MFRFWSWVGLGLGLFGLFIGLFVLDMIFV